MKKLIGLSILVAEDEAELRDVIVDQLLYNGATVEGVSNGAEAWDSIQNKKFDIVLSDSRMPGVNGIELIKKIHQMNSTKPIVFLCTGFSDLTLSEVKKIGVAEVFSKPFDLNKMVNQILISINELQSKKAG
ncbi:MAG: response regulator [Pseudobdellovibrio sp.]